MEPPAALAVYKDGKVEGWAASQSPVGARDAIAAAVGAKKEDVTVNVTLLGGAFGRKSFPDFAVEAAVLAKKTGKPVKGVWSREDDIKLNSYHSVSASDMKATMGELRKYYTNCGGDYALYPIDTARFRRVVQLAAEKSGWGKKKLGNGVGMGIAMHRSFLTYVATVVTMHVDDAGKVHVDRVDQALDAGTVVNPEMVRNQFEVAATFVASIAC